MKDLQKRYERLMKDGHYIDNVSCCGDGQVEYELYSPNEDHVGYIVMSNGQRYGEEAGTIHSLTYQQRC